MPTEQEARPPYVQFEVRAVEDRTQTIAEGRYASKDVIFAIVTPAGSRDRLEKEADSWLHDLRDAVQQDRFPAAWYDSYEKKLAIFKETQQTPEDGTPIMSWPALSPAQVKTVLGANVRTVEDLAVANEETLMRIGMGARALKEKAKAWLEAAEGPGKVAEELAEMREKLEAVLARNSSLEEQVKKLEGAIEINAAAKAKEKA